MTAVLSTHDLSKSFGPTKALQEVSITLNSGKVHTILGENGSGKSTLVKVLSGIIKPDKGHIRMNGIPINTNTPHDMVQQGVSVVLQEVLIAPNMNGYDNVIMGQDGLFKRIKTKNEHKTIVDGWIGKLSNKSIDLNKPAGELTLNEQQVLVVARGFVANPKILILDEITAALDLADRSKVFHEIQAFCANGGAVVFVSHRMPEIMELSHTVFIMYNGANTACIQGNDITPKILLNHLTQGSIQ